MQAVPNKCGALSLYGTSGVPGAAVCMHASRPLPCMRVHIANNLLSRCRRLVVPWVLATQVSRLLCLQLAGILRSAASGALQPAVQGSHSVRSVLIVFCLVVIVAPCRVHVRLATTVFQVPLACRSVAPLFRPRLLLLLLYHSCKNSSVIHQM